LTFVLGFHASTTEEYTIAFSKALSMTADERLAMRQRARQNARRFSEEVFTAKWAEHMDKLVRLQTEMRLSAE
jgi:alpha-1,2-mannosyltransferase